ncbi:putative MFS family arabinose efflux permease [Rhodopseudomonas rhenobacensis]|uniref:Putative MFS family arabinose efflux permease n=1 Tax=Rhodopseudomonas rhenobacensis TaxID=87461 RepID=A0A7W7Z084_9BRAD|nr:YbfB/YjiJ family MFS transporter [Rhodopseudomonas rhenobacensis]MBB5045581.1 putative MFS family arabinose efflux permease [Rhodopseudomonas rhenobacensis]
MPLIDRTPAQPHPTRLILMLALSPTISLGLARFAYSLVLPDMRDALGWSYSAAGFMNTVNAAGYLGGALVAALLVKRFGLFRVVQGGTLACVASLLVCGLSGNFALLGLSRLLAGFGAAVSFVAGGALAATVAQTVPERSSLLLSLFYAGPGLGIVLSGLLAPLLLGLLGPGSWWVVWLALTLVAAVLSLPLLLRPIAAQAARSEAKPARFAVGPVAIYLTSYFLFGAGYIAYMTFMIAYVRDAGGGAAAQSGFWCLIGASAFASPWLWRRLIARGKSGVSLAIVMGVNGLGAALPLLSSSPWMLALSAAVFGVAFFAVVTTTTAFVRFNYPPQAWPSAIAAMTIAFGIGQIIGPIATGAITDATGSLGAALNVSAAALALGALLAALQRPVG